jgi:hypothetical protein
MPKAAKKQTFSASFFSVVFLLVGLGVLWLVRKSLQIEGDAAFLALLFGPLVIYLAFSGKLKDFSILGISVNFFEETVENIKDEIAGVSEYETERNTYFGKLRQILEKETQFCLLYADVDNLRKFTRKIYDTERKQELRSTSDHHPPQKTGSHTVDTTSAPRRRLEKDVRKDVIQHLMFSLTDALYDEKKFDGKYDIFMLEEPDLVMIVRSINLAQAQSIANRGLKYFKKHYGTGATISITRREEFPEAPKPRDLDKEALRRLNWGKEHKKGKVYDITSI